MEKNAFRKSRLRVDLGSHDKTGSLVYFDLLITANNSGTEFDGGNVTFADRPQAQDEAQISSVQPGLVWVRDNRRIKQGGGFDRIFTREISAEKESATV